eukprot:COSAG05_NODE_15945_length_357_cov_0.829457_1_plen_46_part_10
MRSGRPSSPSGGFFFTTTKGEELGLGLGLELGQAQEACLLWFWLPA